MSEQKQAASYQLVPMTIELIPQIAELERLCFSKPWNEQMLAEELDNPTASFIVAVGDNGQVLGYAGISVIAGEGYIDNVAVREEYRRQGAVGCLFALWQGPPAGLFDPGSPGVQRPGQAAVYEARL